MPFGTEYMRTTERCAHCHGRGSTTHTEPLFNAVADARNNHRRVPFSDPGRTRTTPCRNCHGTGSVVVMRHR
jgi:DnaJ-class molecular chaperone